jgi:hypothetical protein
MRPEVLHAERFLFAGVVVATGSAARLSDHAVITRPY